MKRILKRITAFFLLLILLPGGALAAEDIDSGYEKAAQYCLGQIEGLYYDSEWLVLAFCRGGTDLSDGWLTDYYASVAETVESCSGVLSTRNYTDYSRTIIGLTAAGFNATDVAGYDLTKALGDYDMTVSQGLNGPVWALIALDSGCYDIPQNEDAETQATRDLYVDFILSRELDGGGWAFSGTEADPDMTAMTLSALAKYTDNDAVSQAVDRAVTVLSGLQKNDGGYASWDTDNSESVSQVIVALCELGIGLDDARFIKNGYTLISNLLTYQLTDGSFEHIKDAGANGLATQQGFYALAAAKRAGEGSTSLYRIDGYETALFTDIADNEYREQIEALAAAGIINGMGDGTFAPENTMTRAEFCTIVVKALGIELITVNVFDDVDASAWYASYVGSAYTNGIIKGTSETMFSPNGTITDVEADIMLSRAAVLLGLLEQPYESWYPSEICITRCEVAAAVYQLLAEAEMI